MLLPSFAEAATYAAGFFSTKNDKHKSHCPPSKAKAKRTSSLSSSCRQHIILVLVMLLGAAITQQAHAQTGPDCDCQFNHACFPADGVLLKQAVDSFYDGTWDSSSPYGPIEEFCTGFVTNMDSLFESKQFNSEDISKWTVSSVTSMKNMFFGVSRFTEFSVDLSEWDVSSVTDMQHMFMNSGFNGNGIAAWNVSSLKNMVGMFNLNRFFNADLSSWTTSSVTDMKYMFRGASSFNSVLNSWDVSSVESMDSMFSGATSFNSPLDSWRVSSVTNMDYMFSGASSFNAGNIGAWGDSTSSVTTMRSMFKGATLFNDNIDSWDTSKVANMDSMFYEASSFNQSLENWDVSSVTYMYYLFVDTTSFNGDITSWDVSNVGSMGYMFYGASAFNQDLSGWDISAVTDMAGMFYGNSALNQNLCAWKDKNFPYDRSYNIFEESGCTYTERPDLDNPYGPGPFCADDCAVDCDCQFNHACFPADGVLLKEAVDAVLRGTWDSTSPYGPIEEFCTGLVTNMDGLFRAKYLFNSDISKWTVSSVTSMEYMFSGSSFNNVISGWDVSKVTNMKSCFRDSPFTGDVSGWNVSSVTALDSMFQRTSFNGNISNWDTAAVKSMIQMFERNDQFNVGLASWNTAQVTSMASMFEDAKSFNGDVSSWDLSSVTSIRAMFSGAESFNNDVSMWDTSSVVDMSETFQETPLFNSNIGLWNVSSVTSLYATFAVTSSFNIDLSGWDVSNVKTLEYAFYEATAFNQGLSSWDVTGVTNMYYLFWGASAFNQNLCAWKSSTFPYSRSYNIFEDSGCTYTEDPDLANPYGGPFCADDCGPSAQPSMEPSLQPSETPPPQFEIEFTSTVTIGTTTQNVADILFSDTNVLEEFLAAIEAQIRSNICPIDSLNCEVTILTVNGVSVGGTGLVELEFGGGGSLSFQLQASSTDLVIEFVTKIRGICDTDDCSNADTLGALLYSDATDELNGALLDNSFLLALKAALSAYQDILDILDAASVSANFGELVLTPCVASCNTNSSKSGKRGGGRSSKSPKTNAAGTLQAQEMKSGAPFVSVSTPFVFVSAAATTLVCMMAFGV